MSLKLFRICTQAFASFIPYRSRARVVDGTQIEAGGQGDYYSIEAGSQIVVEFVLIDNCVSQFLHFTVAKKRAKLQQWSVYHNDWNWKPLSEQRRRIRNCQGPLYFLHVRSSFMTKVGMNPGVLVILNACTRRQDDLYKGNCFFN